MRNTKVKKEKFETLKNVFFAVKIIKECAPWYITARIASMFGYWFFTGFVQEIWFLKSILQIIENGGTFKEFAVVVIMFAFAGVLGKALHNGFDYVLSSKVKIFYKNHLSSPLIKSFLFSLVENLNIIYLLCSFCQYF